MVHWAWSLQGRDEGTALRAGSGRPAQRRPCPPSLSLARPRPCCTPPPPPPPRCLPVNQAPAAALERPAHFNPTLATASFRPICQADKHCVIGELDLPFRDMVMVNPLARFTG